MRPERLAENRHGLPGPGQLPANGHRQESAQDEEDQPREQKLEADDLVVMRENVLENEAAGRRVNVVLTVAMAGIMAQSGMLLGRRYRRRPAVLDRFGTHPHHLPGVSLDMVSWFWFCSASFSSSHFWNSSAVSCTVTLPRIL